MVNTTETLLLTRREVVLLSGLLFLLLFSANNDLFSLPGPLVDNFATGDNTAMESQLGKYPDPLLWWTDSVPETEIIAHATDFTTKGDSTGTNPRVQGWTIFDRLYVMDGTLFIVTSKPELVPRPLRIITSSGHPVLNGPGERDKRIPSDKDIQVVSPAKAQEIFGNERRSALRFAGNSFLCTDAKQFITHYYHFTAEVMFGIWRAYSTLDPFTSADGHTTLPPIRHWVFRHVHAAQWRDYASMNQWVMRGAFPAVNMEFMEDWAERTEMGVPLVFDRVVLGDRAAADEGESFKTSWRPASNAFDLRGSPHWWAPLRKSVLEYSGLASEWIVGPDPSTLEENQKLVITYISRQSWGRRMLVQADHERLVEELYKLRDRFGYEVNVVSMDKLSRAQQLQLAGRTTIMLGVHGNGLTSLVWMRPTPRSTVIEFYYPKGFMFDYEYTTRALGMVHYGVWNNITFTQPNTPKTPHTPEGFQGNSIPLDGTVVAQLVLKRLTLDSGDGFA